MELKEGNNAPITCSSRARPAPMLDIQIEGVSQTTASKILGICFVSYIQVIIGTFSI